jgi:hypothetical protein
LLTNLPAGNTETTIRLLAERQARYFHPDLIPSSLFFPFHPFANVGSAVFNLRALRFALRKESHYRAIDYADVFQIQNDVPVVRFALKESPQLGNCLFFDLTAQEKHRESPSRRGLNPKTHRLRHSKIAAFATLTLHPSGIAPE